mgnify:FL=1
MNDFIPNIDPVEEAKSLGRMPRKFWQCQNSSCAKVIPNPLRWVYIKETIFDCPYCKNPAVE